MINNYRSQTQHIDNQDFNNIEYISEQSYHRTNSNEELFAEIERSQITFSVSSGDSCNSSNPDNQSLIDQAIDLFTNPKVILPKQQPLMTDCQDEMIKDINQVFSEYTHNNSHLSTYESNETDEQFYESNHRRKRKTISDEDSHQFVVHIDNIQYDRRTTIMVKNIPNKYTIQMLKQLIDQHHQNSYDFLYLPIDFKNKCNMGYAFINFVDTQMIKSFHQCFHGQRWPHFNSEKICQLRYARIQGRQALLQHFQFSSVMNQKDKKLKPVIVPQSELQRIQKLVQKQSQ